MCRAVEQSVASTNSIRVLPRTASSPPHRAKHAYLPAGPHDLWSINGSEHYKINATDVTIVLCKHSTNVSTNCSKTLL